ncbi:MAG: WYL domain-containing protein [Actinomycetota bacterium]|nr:WYL domain-containing protein [Actinomycetota bacterium]
MPADRLVALLLLLQAKKQLTAATAAAELDVSVRTARRDFEALGMAGFPVYSVPGRNGGWRLLGSARTDLSGLTTGEATALVVAARSRSALGDPSTGSAAAKLDLALRKLLHALPDPVREAAEAASKCLVVDRTSWIGRTSDTTPCRLEFLQVVQDAVVATEQVKLGYRAANGSSTQRTVDPLGLVATGFRWYLIGRCPSGLRTFRIDRITNIERLGTHAARPEGFSLAGAWQELKADFRSRFGAVRATGLVSPGALDLCRWMLGTNLSVGQSAADGRVTIEIDGPTPRAIACQVAGLGRDVEVTSPPEVRRELSRIASELRSTYCDDQELPSHPDPPPSVPEEPRDGLERELAAAAPSPAGWTGGMQHTCPRRR